MALQGFEKVQVNGLCHLKGEDCSTARFHILLCREYFVSVSFHKQFLVVCHFMTIDGPAHFEKKAYPFFLNLKGVINSHMNANN